MKNLLLILVALAFLSSCTPSTGPAQGLPEGTPDWVKARVSEYASQPVANPPRSITRYDYKGQTVYYIPSPCCDQYNFLYDAQGQVLCAPDGGFIGRGDGKCPDFVQARTNEQLVWRDNRSR